MGSDAHPFELLDYRFRALSTGRRPLAIPGELLGGGYVGRPVPVLEVREALLRRGTGHPTRNAVLAELVRRAREGEPWITALAGVLLPGLRSIVGPLTRTYPQYRPDLETEALVGLLEALPRARLDRSVAASLIWASRRAADRALDRELKEAGVRARTDVRLAAGRDVSVDDKTSVADLDHEAGDDAVTRRPGGHPEVVLLEACIAGILSGTEADLIAATRLELVPARAYADEFGAGLGSLRLKRYRAERRLVTWLAER